MAYEMQPYPFDRHGGDREDGEWSTTHPSDYEYELERKNLKYSKKQRPRKTMRE